MGNLEQVDENTYRFKNIYIKKHVLDALNKVVNNSMTDEKLRKIYNIIIKE